MKQEGLGRAGSVKKCLGARDGAEGERWRREEHLKHVHSAAWVGVCVWFISCGRTFDTPARACGRHAQCVRAYEWGVSTTLCYLLTFCVFVHVHSMPVISVCIRH